MVTQGNPVFFWTARSDKEMLTTYKAMNYLHNISSNNNGKEAVIKYAPLKM